MLNTVINQDCQDGVPHIPCGTVDAIVTSPPYFAPPYNGQRGLGNTEKEYIDKLVDCLWEAKWSLNPRTGLLFLNLGDGKDALRVPWKVVSALVDRGYDYRGEIVWAWARDEKARGYFDSIYVLGVTPARRLPNRVWFMDPPEDDGLAFPEELPIRCMRSMELPGRGLVLDPFMGIGTTGVAAKKVGWDFIGFELDAERCRLATDRIAGFIGE